MEETATVAAGRCAWRNGKKRNSVNFCGLDILCDNKFNQHSPTLQNGTCINEDCVYEVGGVRPIDKFHKVQIKLITN
jgi:hypothetical protein